MISTGDGNIKETDPGLRQPLERKGQVDGVTGGKRCAFAHCWKVQCSPSASSSVFSIPVLRNNDGCACVFSIS